MPIYTFKDKQIDEVNSTQFSAEGIQERSDLQAALRDKISVISPDTMVMGYGTDSCKNGRHLLKASQIDDFSR